MQIAAAMPIVNQNNADISDLKLFDQLAPQVTMEIDECEIMLLTSWERE